LTGTMTAEAVTASELLDGLFGEELLLSSTIVGMGVGVDANDVQADRSNAIMVTASKNIFFILSYDFPFDLLSFVIKPSCNVTTRLA
jgi:hypothetical protein